MMAMTALRKTVTRTGLAGLLLAGFATLRRTTNPLSASRGDLGLLRPPGAKEEDGFLALCLRCSRCVDACEPRCIELIGAEGGRLQGTPFILPSKRGCTLCLKCGEACPSGAILPLEKMGDAKMGLAEVDKRLCVSHNGTGVCGACNTVCPLRNRAITQDLRNQPEVHSEHCTGCGMCEEICIVRDRRAIRLRTERYHEI